ncbi:MAG: hypothetical protein U5R48_12855 [Gammaproteobacteria bacterium]|nr:hypothetical protein [Gammaproteobacteria bacterium]
MQALAPDFLRAAARVARRRPGTRILVPVLDREAAARIERLAGDLGMEVRVLVDDTRRALAAADLALVKSGHGTLETMLTGRPMVVAYRVGPWTWRLLRRLVRSSPGSALPNLLAGESLVPELLQDAATPEALAEALLSELADWPERRGRFRELAAELRQGAAGRAAEAAPELGAMTEGSGHRTEEFAGDSGPGPGSIFRCRLPGFAPDLPIAGVDEGGRAPGGTPWWWRRPSRTRRARSGSGRLQAAHAAASGAAGCRDPRPGPGLGPGPGPSWT